MAKASSTCTRWLSASFYKPNSHTYGIPQTLRVCNGGEVAPCGRRGTGASVEAVATMLGLPRGRVEFGGTDACGGFASLMPWAHTCGAPEGTLSLHPAGERSPEIA